MVLSLPQGYPAGRASEQGGGGLGGDSGLAVQLSALPLRWGETAVPLRVVGKGYTVDILVKTKVTGH